MLISYSSFKDLRVSDGPTNENRYLWDSGSSPDGLPLLYSASDYFDRKNYLFWRKYLPFNTGSTLKYDENDIHFVNGVFIKTFHSKPKKRLGGFLNWCWESQPPIGRCWKRIDLIGQLSRLITVITWNKHSVFERNGLIKTAR